MTSVPIVSAQSLSLTFETADGPVHALQDVDLEIGAGEFVSFIGPSGCGKTTFLRCVAALETPTAGTLTVEHDTWIYGAPVAAPEDIGSGLIVTRTARIDAQGTAIDPILFTSGREVAQRAPGDWAGVALLGFAPINDGVPEGQVPFEGLEDVKQHRYGEVKTVLRRPNGRPGWPRRVADSVHTAYSLPTTVAAPTTNG